MASKRIEVAGTKLYVDDQGEGEVLLLLHGFPDSHQLWRNQIPALTEAGYRTITPDLRGFGESDNPQDVDDMTVQQSFEMFRNECYQDTGNATQQAARGTYDPAYLNYTMGKLMIRKLREDWTATRGGRTAWKAFHDEFLSYGGPPIPMVRMAMMNEDIASAVF